MKNYSKIYSGL